MMLERTPRRGFLRLLAAAPLAALALRSDSARAKRRKPKKTPVAPTVFDGYAIYPWKTSTITVRDHMPERWHAIHAGMVDAINAAMPTGGPRVVYESAPHQACSVLGRATFEQGVVRICDEDVYLDRGLAVTTLKSGRVFGGLVSIPDGWGEWYGEAEAQRVSCHELMHAMLHVADRDQERDAPKDSCVLGFTPFPGDWDKAAFAMLYGDAMTSSAKASKKRKSRRHH